VITVEGDERAQAVILRAGRKAQDQSSSLEAAGESAGIASPGAWTNRSGKLSGSVSRPRVEASADSVRLLSDVPYARFVFYGTARQEAEPPQINLRVLVTQSSRRVASDLVSP
jgi:hypothetical protein